MDKYVPNVTVSELAQADSYFATLFGLRSRIANLERQFDFSRKVAAVRSEMREQCVQDIKALRLLEARLDSTSLIDHVTLKDVRKEFESYGKSTDHIYNLFGGLMDNRKCGATDPVERQYLADLKQQSIAARVSEHGKRIEDEVVYRSRLGWFIVFNSLTVAPHHYDKVFAPGSTCWRDYIKEVTRAVGASIYGTKRKADLMRGTEPYHTYFAVVERGGENGRLHIHVLHCFRDMPDSWKSDPNKGSPVPKAREVTRLKGYWKYGFSTPIAVRYSGSDAFSRIGWKWPVVIPKGKKTFEPYMAKQPMAMARYMCKYLSKSYESRKGMKQWRTRISRKFGLTRITMLVSRLTDAELADLIDSASALPMVKERTFPKRTLRLQLIRENVKRLKCGSGSPMLIPEKLLKALRAQPPIVERMRFSIERTLEFNRRKIGSLKAKPSRGTVVSEIRKKVVELYPENLTVEREWSYGSL